MRDLLESIIKNLVDNPSDIKITEEVKDNIHRLKLTVNQADMGKIIGKGGKTANAIRSILYAAAAKSKTKVYLDIE